MRKSILFIVLSLAILNIANSTRDGFDKSYKPADAVVSKKAVGDLPKVSYNNIDSPLVDIVWCGANGSTIFILSELNTLYRSEDDGFSGHTLSEHLTKLGKHELGTNEAEVTSTV
jgi:hypothetical protein